MKKFLLLALFFCAYANPARAATYWIDSSKAGGPGCGSSQANACKGWHDLAINNDKLLKSTSADTVNVVSGTYHGNGAGACWGIVTAARTAGNDLVIQCTNASGVYSPGTCTVDAVGANVPSGASLVGFGLVSNCNSAERGSSGLNSAQYVQLKGVNVVADGIGSGDLVGMTKSNHILLRDMRIDGKTSLLKAAFGTDQGVKYISQVNVVVTNCGPNAAFGCNGYQQKSANIAIVGSSFGPRRGFPDIPLNTNQDCITVQGTQTILEDSNSCYGMSDGIDNGEDSADQIGHLIARYNDVRDCFGSVTQTINSSYNDHLFKFSGDSGSGTSTGPAIFYKNVLRFTKPEQWIGGFFYTELSTDVDTWYNTVFSPWHRSNDATNTAILTSAYGGGSMPVLYNIFDGPDTVSGGFPLEVGGTCTASTCPWIGNGLYFKERGTSASCIQAGGLGDFNCDLSNKNGGGNGFNSVGNNSANFTGDPKFKARNTTNQSLEGLQLTSSSGQYLNSGKSFCKAANNGSGGSIAVSCGVNNPSVFNDPKHYFPSPSDYYAVKNEDCIGKGVRAVDGAARGCFDIQIAGCGVVTVTGINANTINFTPACASWAKDAMVHVPWSGAGPDLGAIEFSQGTSKRPKPPTLNQARGVQ